VVNVDYVKSLLTTIRDELSSGRSMNIASVLGTCAAVTFGGILALRYYCPWLVYDIKLLRRAIALGYGYITMKRKMELRVDKFEEVAGRLPNKTMLIFEDKHYTYAEMNENMNRVANGAVKLGLKKGDVVAIMMYNGPEFIYTWMGLSKIGVCCAFINFNLRSTSLKHCFDVCKPQAVFIGEESELITAVSDIYQPEQELNNNAKVYVWGSPVDLPAHFQAISTHFAQSSNERPDPALRAVKSYNEAFCYIYTSGTTGLPKAAVVSHAKSSKGAVLIGWKSLRSDDVIYTALPLYHSAASMIAFCGAVNSSLTLVLRKKFSVRNFWSDCRKHNVTIIQYIGELCRFLLTQPENSSDRDHNVRVAVGNGLRADIWKEFDRRFGIPDIMEFYSATESNWGTINIYNKMGSIGRLSPITQKIYPAHLVQYDYSTGTPLRGSDGRCVVAAHRQPGLLITPIRKMQEYEGYVGVSEENDPKVLHNVFCQGDRFFNSGDILTIDEDYFVYFTDRLGDTFRWKGENVSTVEVANAVCELSWVQDAVVYGVTVPGQDGRAGMASLSLHGGEGEEAGKFTLDEAACSQLFQHCTKLLPDYAIPRFLRVQQKFEMTSTFKQRKVDLVKDGFDPDNCKDDALFVVDMKNKFYKSLADQDTYKNICDGVIRL